MKGGADAESGVAVVAVVLGLVVFDPELSLLVVEVWDCKGRGGGEEELVLLEAAGAAGDWEREGCAGEEPVEVAGENSLFFVRAMLRVVAREKND